jgi:SPP1 family predicted phage head-tail adaptor
MAARLNHRVTVYRKVAGEDAAGQPLAKWAEAEKRWANVRVLSGIETIRAGADTSIVRASIQMHFNTDIDATVRLWHDGIMYDVKARLPHRSVGRVDFTCESVTL